MNKKSQKQYTKTLERKQRKIEKRLERKQSVCAQRADRWKEQEQPWFFLIREVLQTKKVLKRIYGYKKAHHQLIKNDNFLFTFTISVMLNI